MEGCYMIITYGGISSGAISVELPCYPDDLKEDVSSMWSQETVVGRTAPLAAYANTGFRGVSFSFTIHREMQSKTSIEEVLRAIRKTVYPIYDSKGLRPPITRFVFGSFVANGFVESFGFSWSKPIINGLYQICNISISMKCVPSAVFSSTELGNSVNPFKDSLSAGIVNNNTVAVDNAINQEYNNVMGAATNMLNVINFLNR